MTATVDRQYQLNSDGTPRYVPNNPVAARLISLAAHCSHIEGWEAADGEELSVLVLWDQAGMMVGAIPAPADDQTWLAAFDQATTLTVLDDQTPRELTIQNH